MSNHRSTSDPQIPEIRLLLRGRLLVAAMALFIVACGGGRIILNLDIHSFLADDEKLAPYDEDVAPGVGWLPLLTIVPPTEINLIEGMGSVTVLEEGVITIGGNLHNVLGTATARLRVHVAATAQEVLVSVSPLFSTVVSVTPDTTTPFAGSVVFDDATLDLFGGDSVWVRVDIQVQVPSATQSTQVQGEAELTELRARLVSAENLFD